MNSVPFKSTLCFFFSFKNKMYRMYKLGFEYDFYSVKYYK